MEPRLSGCRGAGIIAASTTAWILGERRPATALSYSESIGMDSKASLHVFLVLICLSIAGLGASLLFCGHSSVRTKVRQVIMWCADTEDLCLHLGILKFRAPDVSLAFILIEALGDAHLNWKCPWRIEDYYLSMENECV